ncbi:MAG TPA: hypothetical protein VEB20_22515 [Azospirillaceae bacterium]|nr:hypothetical protein [Azospirillaceae bacterium]
MSETDVEILTQLRNLLLLSHNQNSSSQQLALHQFWSQEMEKPRNREPKRLLRHGFKMYSQADEDGIIEEIFRRIGTSSKIFVEFGVERGVECNTLKLLLEGWRGLWIDGGEANVQTMAASHADWIGRGQLVIQQAFITSENIDSLIVSGVGGQDVDFLSIDIDRNDYWVWDAIRSIRPRAVCIEYNPTWRPPLSVVAEYGAERMWDGTNYFGASLEALTVLGREKGYRLVGCSFSGVNAFFVREDLCGDRFHEPATAAEHYEPARFFFCGLRSGHNPGIGPLVTV